MKDNLQNYTFCLLMYQIKTYSTNRLPEEECKTASKIFFRKCQKLLQLDVTENGKCYIIATFIKANEINYNPTGFLKN